MFLIISLREKSNTLLLRLLHNLAEWAEKFQSALYRHYESGGLSLYRSDEMQTLVRLMHHIPFTSSSVQ